MEFVESIAAANALRRTQIDGGGGTAVAAGIVGNADLMLGDAVEPVLEALAEAGKGRFRGIRCTAAWDASPEITTARANSAGMLADPNFRRGLACLDRMGLAFDCIVYHPQLPEVAEMARAFPYLTIILNHVGTTSWHRAVRGTKGGTDARVAERDRRCRRVPERGGQGWRTGQPNQRV